VTINKKANAHFSLKIKIYTLNLLDQPSMVWNPTLLSMVAVLQ